MSLLRPFRPHRRTLRLLVSPLLVTAAGAAVTGAGPARDARAAVSPFGQAVPAPVAATAGGSPYRVSEE
ncbi:hypothetical protein [Streptomyces sp. NPDC006997]|uniref:hypothetical protein n=1 Tax=Streptomyces sp. NPDC006997 TaxID=3155356 RepID=UPI0033C3FE8E